MTKSLGTTRRPLTSTERWSSISRTSRRPSSIGRMPLREPRNTPSTIRSSRRSNDCSPMVADDATGGVRGARGRLGRPLRSVVWFRPDRAETKRQFGPERLDVLGERGRAAGTAAPRSSRHRPAMPRSPTRSPRSTPMAVTATMIGRPVAPKRARARRSTAGAPAGAASVLGSPRTARRRRTNRGSSNSAVESSSRASRSNVTPVLMKKIGTRKPNPMASSFDSISACAGSSALLARIRKMIPAANAPSSMSIPSQMLSPASTATSSTTRRTAN